jgi:hypothetical protein
MQAIDIDHIAGISTGLPGRSRLWQLCTCLSFLCDAARSDIRKGREQRVGHRRKRFFRSIRITTT